MPTELSFVLSRDVYFPKRKIPTLFIVFFLLFQAVGLDFGFASALERKYRIIVQRATRFVSILSFVVMLAYVVYAPNYVWHWVTAFKNNILILVLITMRYKPYHLIYDINQICALTTKQIRILNIIPILYTFLMYSFKIIFMTAKCIWWQESSCFRFHKVFYFFVFLGINLSLDVIVVTQIIITYYLKCSINITKVLLKRPNRKLDVFEKSYRAIANCYDKIRPFYDWMVRFD